VRGGSWRVAKFGGLALAYMVRSLLLRKVRLRDWVLLDVFWEEGGGGATVIHTCHCGYLASLRHCCSG
jgi:hypothetical protein